MAVCADLVLIFFFFVETAGKTLEELNVIFDSKNPRKASTQKTTVALDEDANFLGKVVEEKDHA